MHDTHVLPEKAEILKIGSWDHARDAPVGWVFGPCRVGVAPDANGTSRLGGYTIDELRELYQASFSFGYPTDVHLLGL